MVKIQNSKFKQKVNKFKLLNKKFKLKIIRKDYLIFKMN